jgi:hypothetical protein
MCSGGRRCTATVVVVLASVEEAGAVELASERLVVAEVRPIFVASSPIVGAPLSASASRTPA